jgi:hypothetical protein
MRNIAVRKPLNANVPAPALVQLRMHMSACVTRRANLMPLCGMRDFVHGWTCLFANAIAHVLGTISLCNIDLLADSAADNS